jgi:hypothetical protein
MDCVVKQLFLLWNCPSYLQIRCVFFLINRKPNSLVTYVLFICLSSARQQSVFTYPKQRATVLVGSVLKWRTKPQCLHRHKSVFVYPKQRATLSVGYVLKWRARPQCLRRRRDFVLQMNNTYVELHSCRPWKDHFKSDLRSDQDHRQKNDLRSFKKII